MRGIRDAISQLPSWPGFVLGAIAVIGIGGWYYGTSYVKCVDLREGREGLKSAIEQAARSGSGILDLGKAVAGDWDEARIVQGHRPGQTPLNCPFGWDLTWRERQALVEANQYTILGFFKADQFQHFVEYRGDWAQFVEVPAKLPRAQAVFTVERPKEATSPYRLVLSR